MTKEEIIDKVYLKAKLIGRGIPAGWRCLLSLGNPMDYRNFDSRFRGNNRVLAKSKNSQIIGDEFLEKRLYTDIR